MLAYYTAVRSQNSQRLFSDQLFLIIVRNTLYFTLFPYTTLFRSDGGHGEFGGVATRTEIGRSYYVSVATRSEEHTSELQSLTNLVCRLLLEKKNTKWWLEKWKTDTIVESMTHGAAASSTWSNNID